jgi:hypothetical protein
MLAISRSFIEIVKLLLPGEMQQKGKNVQDIATTFIQAESQ